MNKEWLEAKKTEIAHKKVELFNKLENYVNGMNSITSRDKDIIISTVRQKAKDECFYGISNIKCIVGEKLIEDSLNIFSEGTSKEIRSNVRSYVGKVIREKFDWKYVENIIQLFKDEYYLSSYLDSAPVHFDGDIIITDPCYIMKNDDWSNTDYGGNMNAIGIEHYMTRDTIFGDWSCTTYDSNTNKPIGNFCADAGLVSVIALDEVLKYNPGFDYHINKKWTTTLIENFCGDVQFVVVEDKWKGENGKEYVDYEVRVVGHGVNKVTNEPIDFITSQTGF